MNPFKNAMQQCFKKTHNKKPQNIDVLSACLFDQVLTLSNNHSPGVSPVSDSFTSNKTGQLQTTDIKPPTAFSHLTSNFPTSPLSTSVLQRGDSSQSSKSTSRAASRAARSRRKASRKKKSSGGYSNLLSIVPNPDPTRESISLRERQSSESRLAAEGHIASAGSCMIGTVCGKRKSPFLIPGETDPVDSCYVLTFAPLKRPRKEKMVRLLDLSEDILVNIMTHVMTPAKEGSRRIITEESIRASLPLAVTCHSLYDLWRHSMHDLELWVSGKLNDRGLNAICKDNGRGIHRLGLRRCKDVSQKAFAQIPRHCSRLRSLDMSHTDITDDFILDLTKSTGRTMQFLALHGCTRLTARSIHAIADRCPHLRFLDIGSIPAVDDAAVGYLVQKLGTSIRTMVLSNCKHLSDTAMATIAAKCKSLMSLTIRGLPSITDNGLHKLCSGIGERVQILDVLDCTGLTMGGYIATMEAFCPHVFRYLEESNYVEHLGERCLRDNIIATMPGLIYRISATDAIRRLPALYFLLLDESTLRPFRVSVQSKSLNLSDFGTVLISNFGKKPTPKTKNVLLSRFGYDSPFDSESDEESCERA